MTIDAASNPYPHGSRQPAAAWSLPLWLHVSLLLLASTLCTAAALLWLPTGWRWLGVATVVLAGAGFSRTLTQVLRRLAVEADAIRGFDFSDHPVVRSRVREADALGNGLDLMRDTVRRFLALNHELVREDAIDRLLPLLLHDMQQAAEAHSGVLYQADPADGTLRAQACGGGLGMVDPAALAAIAPGAIPSLPARAFDLRHAVSSTLDAESRAAWGLPDSLTVNETLIAVPLFDRRGHGTGLLLLFGSHVNDAGKRRFLDALAASAGLILETRGLLQDRKQLLDAVIRMLAGAIDAQSPYTGGHCARVPELMQLLVTAACEAEQGPFAQFSLDADGWEAVHIASWLHDCGKIATPEYVVDKATKLETIHNRIHDVRTRFEVLKRDAEIDCWRAIAEGGDRTALLHRLRDQHAVLDAEFAFVAQCNVGGEYLGDAERDRLRRVGSRTWMRTLDDRIGLSQEELARCQGPAAALPASEMLLADKPEHRIAHPPLDAAAQARLASFRMPRPALRCDRGELHNLGVSRGTLTMEERYTINEHMIHTLVMLEQLPFPPHLRCVPELAGAHHEKMDGTGYPRQLRREQMSPAARMLAVADVFEALTAADRPYKTAKTLSESLAIMARMCRDAHLDPDIFALFLRSGVPQVYGERFLIPAQCDAVDVDALLGVAGVASAD